MLSYTSFQLVKHLRGYPLCCESYRPVHTFGAVVLVVVLGLANLAADLAFASHAKQVATLRDPPLSFYSECCAP